MSNSGRLQIAMLFACLIIFAIWIHSYWVGHGIVLKANAQADGSATSISLHSAYGRLALGIERLDGISWKSRNTGYFRLPISNGAEELQEVVEDFRDHNGWYVSGFAFRSSAAGSETYRWFMIPYWAVLMLPVGIGGTARLLRRPRQSVTTVRGFDVA